MAVRVRYAPSPTGSPHVGNLRTAIFDWLTARKYGGQFIARLEDTDRDPERYKPEYINEIERSLDWLGIVPDEWWVSGGPYGPYVQSERLELYRTAASAMVDTGKAYPCFCDEERLAELRQANRRGGAATGYDRACRALPETERQRRLEAGEPHTIRLAVPDDEIIEYTDLIYGHVSVHSSTMDDQVILKSNGWPTYHLAVVVDDHAMGITHVIRGEDWMSSLPKQALIYAALGWEQPRWAHIPLTLGPDRKKLSKRHGATRFTEFIDAGYLPEAIFNFLVLLGWSSGSDNVEIMSVEEIVERFTLEGIGRTPAIFDYDKLIWMNSEHLKRCPIERLMHLCLPHLAAAGLCGHELQADEMAYLQQALPLAVERMRLLPDVVDQAGYFLRDPQEPEEKGRNKWLNGEPARARLRASIEACSSMVDDWTALRLEAMVNAVAEGLGIARAPLIHTLRVATSGRTVGPGLFEMLEVLGRTRVIRRLKHAISWVQE